MTHVEYMTELVPQIHSCMIYMSQGNSMISGEFLWWFIFDVVQEARGQALNLTYNTLHKEHLRGMLLEQKDIFTAQ